MLASYLLEGRDNCEEDGMPTIGDTYYFASKTNGSTQKKKAVVLIHGAGGNHLHWPHNLRRINGHQVYAPDLPGHGKSGGLGEQSVAGYADWVADWMKSIGIKDAIVAGHSMGGAIAQTLAVEHPELVSALILVATGAKLNVNPELLLKLSTPSSTPAAIEQIIRWSWMPDTEKKLLSKVRDQMLSTRTAVLYGDYLACNNFDLSAELKSIKAPTLVIAGEEDRMTPLDLNRQLENGIRKAQMAVIPEAGHMVMLEKPELVAHETAEFLSRAN